MVERVLLQILGERKTNFQEKVSVFTRACRSALAPMSKPEVLDFELRRDIDKYDKETLLGFFIPVATQRSRRLLPKEELARLKAFLETEDEPRWCEVK